jgi:hypothetical protein
MGQMGWLNKTDYLCGILAASGALETLDTPVLKTKVIPELYGKFVRGFFQEPLLVRPEEKVPEIIKRFNAQEPSLIQKLTARTPDEAIKMSKTRAAVENSRRSKLLR